VFGDAGCATYAPDLPGHGLSAGLRGHIDRFDGYLDVLQKMFEIAQKDHPGVQCILFGHSMGGLIAAQFLLEHQAAFIAAVLTGAAIQLPQKPSALGTLGVRLLAAVRPRTGVSQLDASRVSRDPVVVSAYENDPLNFRGKITAGLATELYLAMRHVIDNAATIRLPILILHGGEDRITAVDGSRLLHAAISSEDRELKIYDGLYHEILNEPERQQVMADIIQWLDTRLAD
jgi:alpha-beta hydrolase superfamily lysophospholipase